MRIATWNINGIRARLDFLRAWLAARRPDVLGLQETKVEDALFPRDAIEADGYHVAFHGEKGRNGVAILSRTGLEEVHRGLPGRPADGTRFLAARTAGLRFATVYVPNGKHVGHTDFARKLEWLDALAAHLEAHERPDDALVLCGDLNIAPSALDTFDEERLAGSIFHTEEERAHFARLLAWGLHDLFREKHPTLRAYSWWDYRAGAFHRGHGLRIDFLLGTEPVARRVREVTIDRDWRKKHEGRTPSDHAPVYADLE